MDLCCGRVPASVPHWQIYLLVSGCDAAATIDKNLSAITLARSALRGVGYPFFSSSHENTGVWRWEFFPAYEDAFAILRAPHKMILERKDRTSIDSVPIISHVRIATQWSISVKHQIKLFFTTERRPIPPPAKAGGPLSLKTYGRDARCRSQERRRPEGRRYDGGAICCAERGHGGWG